LGRNTIRWAIWPLIEGEGLSWKGKELHLAEKHIVELWHLLMATWNKLAGRYNKINCIYVGVEEAIVAG
jgi:hypothetical protein